MDKNNTVKEDLLVTVMGVEKELAKKIGNNMYSAITVIKQKNMVLDLRRFHRVIIAADIGEALRELSKEKPPGKTIKYTNEAYGKVEAKVEKIPYGEDHKYVLVINVNSAAHLLPKQEDGQESNGFQFAVHLVYHELCHIHDGNKQYDALPEIRQKYNCKGKEEYIRPPAEMCWSEYIAEYLASPYAESIWINSITESFVDALDRTKNEFDKEILSYRIGGSIDDFVNYFQRHGDFLLKVASYNMGLLEALGDTKRSEFDKVHKAIEGSYFESTWNGMKNALSNMHDKYPANWKDISVFDELADVIENYYDVLGFRVQDTDEGVYIDIPHRAENSYLV